MESQDCGTWSTIGEEAWTVVAKNCSCEEVIYSDWIDSIWWIFLDSKGYFSYVLPGSFCVFFIQHSFSSNFLQSANVTLYFTSCNTQLSFQFAIVWILLDFFS